MPVVKYYWREKSNVLCLFTFIFKLNPSTSLHFGAKYFLPIAKHYLLNHYFSYIWRLRAQEPRNSHLTGPNPQENFKERFFNEILISVQLDKGCECLRKTFPSFPSTCAVRKACPAAWGKGFQLCRCLKNPLTFTLVCRAQIW